MKFVMMVSVTGMYHNNGRPVGIYERRQNCVDAVVAIRPKHKELFFWTEALNDSAHPGPLAYHDDYSGGQG